MSPGTASRYPQLSHARAPEPDATKPLARVVPSEFQQTLLGFAYKITGFADADTPYLDLLSAVLGYASLIAMKLPEGDPLHESVEQITAAAKAYAAAKNRVVVIGTGISASEEASLQALNLALLKDAGVLPLLPEANALGVMQMGCLPDLGPGFTKVKKAGKGYGDMRSGMKSLFVAGNVPDEIP